MALCGASRLRVSQKPCRPPRERRYLTTGASGNSEWTPLGTPHYRVSRVKSSRVSQATTPDKVPVNFMAELAELQGRLDALLRLAQYQRRGAVECFPRAHDQGGQSQIISLRGPFVHAYVLEFEPWLCLGLNPHHQRGLALVEASPT